MRHIMVLNSKGGCGKSTLATNIASYYATEGAAVGLADYDPQRSSLDWLDRRPDDRPEIIGITGFEGGLRHAPRNLDVVVIDAPARKWNNAAMASVRASIQATQRTPLPHCSTSEPSALNTR